MAHERTDSYLKDSLSLFKHYKRLGENAIAQCHEEALTATLDGENNSVAIVVNHMAGNMLSRWTDFLTSDGEKPRCNRDSEFEDAPNTWAEVLEMWNTGWQCMFAALEPLDDASLTKTEP